MVNGMTRDQNKAVTGFTLLIPALPSEAMGEATFLSESDHVHHVRAITLVEIKATARRLRGAETARFDALLSLRDALESRDQLALERALGHIKEFYRLRQAEEPESATFDKDFSEDDYERFLGEMRWARVGLSPEETGKYIRGRRLGPRAEADPRRLFSYEVSQAVGFHSEDAKVVLWWVDGEFRPAIYCPDAKTALYIHTFFLAPTGGLGFRICPYDGEQFFQDRPNQEYCCPAHREAHRVARFRDKKKRKAAESAQKARKHGTKKAR